MQAELSVRERSIEGLYVREVAPPAPLFAPAILFIHGSWHGAFCWEGWQARFAHFGWRNAALSFRNHMGSYGLEHDAYCRLTVFDYIDDCRAVLASLGLSGPVLIGHSMGGVIAQKLAEILCSEFVPPAALVGLASVSPEAVGPIRNHFLSEDNPITLSPELARRLLFSTISDEAFSEFYPKLRPESPSVQNWTGGGRTPVDPQLITCPKLFVGAGADAAGIHPAARLAGFYSTKPPADWTEIPGAGHNLMMEPCEGAVAATINAWLTARIGALGAPPPQPAHHYPPQPPR